MSGSLDNTKIKKIKEKIDKIRKIIDIQGPFAYYLIDDGVKLVSKDHKKSIAKKELLNKINKKARYINHHVYEVELVIDTQYIKKEDKLIGGPVSLKIKEYDIDDKFKLNYESGYKTGAVWYTNLDLLSGLFHFSDIKNIIKQIDDRNINILSVGKVRAVKILEQ